MAHFYSDGANCQKMFPFFYCGSSKGTNLVIKIHHNISFIFHNVLLKFKYVNIYFYLPIFNVLVKLEIILINKPDLLF